MNKSPIRSPSRKWLNRPKTVKSQSRECKVGEPNITLNGGVNHQIKLYEMSNKTRNSNPKYLIQGEKSLKVIICLIFHQIKFFFAIYLTLNEENLLISNLSPFGYFRSLKHQFWAFLRPQKLHRNVENLRDISSKPFIQNLL